MMTMGQAAKAAGVSKSTLSRAIKSGMMSAKRNDRGGYDIDPAELFRVYPCNTEQPSAQPDMTQHATGVEPLKMQSQIDLLTLEVSMLRKANERLERECEGWREQADVLRRQVTYHSSSQPTLNESISALLKEIAGRETRHAEPVGMVQWIKSIFK